MGNICVGDMFAILPCKEYPTGWVGRVEKIYSGLILWQDGTHTDISYLMSEEAKEHWGRVVKL